MCVVVCCAHLWAVVSFGLLEVCCPRPLLQNVRVLCSAQGIVFVEACKKCVVQGHSCCGGVLFSHQDIF